MSHPARFRGWLNANHRFRIGHRQYVLSTFRHTWLIGAQYSHAFEGWIWHLGPIAVKTWRADQ